MVKPLKIYLDTSVVNFLYADDAPEYKKVTEELFDKYIAWGRYETFISDFVLQEIENTRNEEKKIKLQNVITKYPIAKIGIMQTQDIEIKNLALKYINAGIIPQKKLFDALHIAVSVIFGLPFLVSWNFRHLANVNKEARILAVNYENGFLNNIRIITLLQLMNDER